MAALGIGKRNESIIPRMAIPAKVWIVVNKIVYSKPIIVNGGIAKIGFPLTGSTQSEAVQAGKL